MKKKNIRAVTKPEENYTLKTKYKYNHQACIGMLSSQTIPLLNSSPGQKWKELFAAMK